MSMAVNLGLASEQATIMPAALTKHAPEAMIFIAFRLFMCSIINRGLADQVIR
jgi:hypothetical protein